MKIKEQTRKVAGCSKHRFEVVDKTDEVSSKHCFEVADIEVVDRTDDVSSRHCFEVADRTWFEEIFEEYIHLRHHRSPLTGH
ncbi:chlorohydrolase [Streptococcus pneumoniae]|nr:chlorohydrolase [Streptococcus pneumoniae]